MLILTVSIAQTKLARSSAISKSPILLLRKYEDAGKLDAAPEYTIRCTGAIAICLSDHHSEVNRDQYDEAKHNGDWLADDTWHCLTSINQSGLRTDFFNASQRNICEVIRHKDVWLFSRAIDI